mmetsp:Transcript_25910/g.31449  ORF Transcript_25910/g.31449 Transcript_25910/m.31449 type:complete len:211 (+) Transcript_25910:102-734(+)|eukprot:CAMPEP_0197858792 /NCGR_PEP_ID=MMETSP1438-20131217/32849_1 /TAXON_ID=1461541 /ORGANISM="Pterosperma sp., Strain CCMP1384" /LENGTH=210 /DNA_ID=CAMNT_0043475057 /DNA_START=79 /DNA_END=711 /DNA_ORIENTATION=+
MADEEEEPPPPVTWKTIPPEPEEGEEPAEPEEGERDEEGVPIGTGCMTYPDGATFVGTLAAGGKRTGKGKYTFANGAVFEGDYVDNVKTGSGTMTYPDGSSYTGGWVSDKKEGEGVYKYASGDVYKGGFKADKKDGDGSYLFKESRSTFMGKWVAGEMVDGEWILKDGTIFKGTFGKNSPAVGTYDFAKTETSVKGKFDKEGYFIEVPSA